MQVVDLSVPFSQTALAELVGVTQPAISAMVSDGKLQGDGTLGEVLQAYCQRLRLQAAGRGMRLDGCMEGRTALAQRQIEFRREQQEEKGRKKIRPVEIW